MTFTNNLIHLSPFLLFILIILFGALFAGFSTFIFRKYVKLEILRSHNEVTGFLFLAISGFSSLLLSFSIFVVWDQLNETHSNVSKEGSSAMALYHDIKFYPDTASSKQLMAEYLDFVYNILDEEIPNMELMKKPSQNTSESFNRVFYQMERLNPQTQFQVQLVGGMFSHLNELASFRGLRTSSIETEIPRPMWLPLIFGALVTILCAMLLDIEHTGMHIGLNSLLGMVLGMFFFTIILLDHPYTGSLAIKSNSYKEIFTLEHWANEHHPKK
jgi:hypothetical protein